MYCALNLEDFFDHQGVYDCGYHHTFSASFNPISDAHGRKWAELLVSGGLLLIIVFPLTTQRRHRPLWPIDPPLVCRVVVRM